MSATHSINNRTIYMTIMGILFSVMLLSIGAGLRFYIVISNTPEQNPQAVAPQQQLLLQALSLKDQVIPVIQLVDDPVTQEVTTPESTDLPIDQQTPLIDENSEEVAPEDSDI